MKYRLFVNAERTVLVRVWENGVAEVATRPDPGAVWGPPIILLNEEKTS